MANNNFIDQISSEVPILIAGQTASGKSQLALQIAEKGDRVIVNADAIQVYKNWRILTARPSIADEALTTHILYGHIPAQIDYSVGHWLKSNNCWWNRPIFFFLNKWLDRYSNYSRSNKIRSKKQSS